jgi:hypothetical protein
LSLIYPSLLIVLVICLMVFLITFVVPKFAELYHSMSAQLPAATQILIAIGTTARNYILFGFVGLILAASPFAFGPKPKRAKSGWIAGGCALPWWAKSGSNIKWRSSPACWARCWWAAFRCCRRWKPRPVPRYAALEENAGEAGQMVKEGQSLSGAGQNQNLSGAFDRHDRSGRIHRCAAPDAGQRGRVL